MNSAKKVGVNNNQLYASLKRGDSDHNSLKKSAIVAALKSRGNTPQEISDESGICIAQVYNYLKINAMPEKVKKFILEGQINATEVLRLKRNKTQKAFIKDIEGYIKAKEKNQIQSFTNNLSKKGVSPQKKNKLLSDLERIFRYYSPLKVTKQKINLAANVINQLMIS